MDTKKLRQKILDLAIHGKLVPQDPNDEPASVLLDRIRAEKEQLIKEGKIKAPKKSKSAGDTFHYPKDVQFEVPKGWCVSHIGDVVRLVNGRAYKKEELLRQGKYKVLRVGNFFTNDSWYYSDLELDDDKYCDNGDLLYAWSASFGAKIWNDGKAIFHYHIWKVQYDERLFDKEFLYYFLEWDKQTILNSTTGSTMIHVSMENMKPRAIVIPPKPEQKHIVSAIEEWNTVINMLEQSSKDVKNNALAAKAKILNLAICGKLVPQDPNDEPAVELLKRINPAFQPSDNLHYGEKLPSGWAYATLGEISDYGHCTSVSTDEISETEWVLELEDIEKDTGRLLKKVTKSERAISGSRHVFYKGQVLYSKLRTYLNKVFVADGCGFCTTEIIPITPKDGITAEYLNMYLRSPFFLAYTAQCGYGVKMPRLGTSDARKAIVPVPPAMEQQRIVTVTKQLFAQIEALADSLL